MKNIFIDTNIFLDLILKRKPFYLSAENLLNLCSKRKVHGFTSSLSINSITYFIRKTNPTDYKIILLYILSYITVVPTTHTNLIEGLQSSFTDTEDAYQYYTATNKAGIQYLITRNKKDFKASTIKVLLPEEFLKLI